MAKSANNLPAIGIFGGTFDPVHFGHLRSALEVCQQLELDHVRLMPCHVTPHRPQPQLKAAERRLLLELAVKSCPALTVDDRELTRDGPSYSADTLLSLRSEFPDNPLFLILGSDAFRQIDSWSRWTQLLDLALDLSAALQKWLTENLGRPADRESAAGKIWPVAVTPLAISATDIRAQRVVGESVQFLLPEAVLTTIDQLGWYPAQN